VEAIAWVRAVLAGIVRPTGARPVEAIRGRLGPLLAEIVRPTGARPVEAIRGRLGPLLAEIVRPTGARPVEAHQGAALSAAGGWGLELSACSSPAAMAVCPTGLVPVDSMIPARKMRAR